MARGFAESGGNGAVSSIKKIKFPDKLRNLESLGKHVSVGAFKEKMDLNVQTNPLEQLMKEIAADAQEAEQIH